MKVTRGLLEAIKESPNQSLLVSKLSSEIGLSRTLEKALLARRMLIASMREPNIAATPNAMKTLERSLTLLDRDIGRPFAFSKALSGKPVSLKETVSP